MQPPPTIHTREWRGWTLHECDALGSTNDHARDLPPWHAIRAHVQTGARGRHGRSWASNAGGLWFSAVLPLDPPDRGWAAFPLAAGLAVVSTLRGLGLGEARLRWPNDVLVGPRKICGILMEKFSSDRVVVGLGLNVTNRPADAIPHSHRLPPPWPKSCRFRRQPTISIEILTALRILHGRVAEDGFTSLADDINSHWGGTREVELQLPGETVRGRFLGIDSVATSSWKSTGTGLPFRTPCGSCGKCEQLPP